MLADVVLDNLSVEGDAAIEVERLADKIYRPERSLEIEKQYALRTSPIYSI